MHIKLQGTNLSLTPEIRSFVHKKLKDCQRALGDVNPGAVHIAIELERTTRRHPMERRDEQLYRAEANVKVPGRLIRAEESAMHLEQAIVQMKNTLTRNIRHWRERAIERKRKGGRAVKAMHTIQHSFVPSLSDEWDEPQLSSLSSPYEEYFDSGTKPGPEIWAGVREDDRDFI